MISRKKLIFAHCIFFMRLICMDGPQTFFILFRGHHQNKFHQFYLGTTIEDGTILDSNDTIALDDCPPHTPDFVYVFTFWVEGIIQVCILCIQYFFYFCHIVN